MGIIRRTATLFIMCVSMISRADAEPLPAGCYVTDAERALYSGSYTCDNCDQPSCFNSSDGYYSFLTPGNTSPDGLVAQYGDAVYALINSGYQASVESAANYVAYRAQLKLVKRLRQACGSRCRRIK